MKRPCPGFTLVELLVVASIMAILFSLSTAYYNQFNRSQILNQAVLELKNNLRLAQSMALTGEKPSSGCASPLTLDGYQVNFSANLYRIQAKCSGALAGTEKVFNLSSAVAFQPVPAVPVLFKVLAGGVTGSGPITLSAFGTTKTVTVTSTGEIR